MLSAFQRNIDPCVDTVGPTAILDSYIAASPPPEGRITAKYIELNEVTEIPKLRSSALMRSLTALVAARFSRVPTFSRGLLR